MLNKFISKKFLLSGLFVLFFLSLPNSLAAAGPISISSLVNAYRNYVAPASVSPLIIQGQGPRGTQGIQGPRGLTGLMGPMGLTGPMGPRGPSGSSNLDSSLFVSRALFDGQVNGIFNSIDSFRDSLAQEIDTELLNVSGNATIGGNLTVTGTISGSVTAASPLLLGDGTSAAPSLAFASDTNTGLYRAGEDDLRLVTNGTDRIFIGPNGIIGLGVTGTGASNTSVVIRGTFGFYDSISSTYFNQTLGASASDGLIMQYPTNTAFVLRDDSGTQMLRISSVGNVAIGPHSPNAKLDIMGNTFLFGSNNTSQLLRTDATVKNMHIDTPHFTNAQSPVFLIGAQNSAADNAIYIGNSLAGAANAATTIRFATGATTTTATGTERMRIDASGNVGIGTIASVRLHALTDDAATSTVTDVIELSHSSTGTPAASFGTGLLFNGESTATDRNMARIQSIWTTATDASRASALQFQTLTGAGALTTRMTIDGAGNVGIGTATPAAMLSVGSTSQFQVSSAGLVTYVDGTTNTATAVCKNAAGQLAACSATGTGAAFVQNGNSFGATAVLGTNDANDLQFETGNSTKMTILNSSGNVGIGTTTPGSLLHVATSTTALGLTLFEQASTDADGYDLNFRKARGTVASPTVITSVDELGVINFRGYSGASGYVTGAAIKGISSGTIADTRIPGQLSFWTGTDATPSVLTERWQITNAGHLFAATDGAYNIGNAASSRPGTIFASAAVSSPIFNTSTNSSMTITPTGATNGSIILTPTGNGILQAQRADPTIVFNVVTATDTDYWMGVQDDAGSDDDDILQIGKGVTPGGTPLVTFTTAGNMKIAGVALRATTEGTNHLDIFDGTAPVGTLANGISLYSTAGELRVMDSAGNATLLSPHENINNYWVFDSSNKGTGKSLIIDMELMMKKLNETFGWDYVHETGGDYNPATVLTITDTIKDLDLRIKDLEENSLSGNTGSLASSLGTYATAFFNNALQKVENGVAYMKGIVTETLKVGSPTKRTGITLYDEVTGDPYCLSIANGDQKTTEGICEVIEETQEPPASSGGGASGDGGGESPSPDPEPTPEPAPEPELTPDPTPEPIPDPVPEPEVTP